MIIGPSDTPYADGFYFFKFKFPKEYPFKPPTLTYCTNDGTTRFNPNLYRNGKVCVSILNTWKGDQWTSCQSIRSILLTLVTLLNENPLTNEPGFPATHRSCMPYKRMIEYMNFKISILGMLNKGSLQPKFLTYYPILKKYFMENKNQIMERITELEKSDYNLKEDRISVYNMCVKYDYNDLKSKFEEQIKVLE
jgi:ubiquitin-conjugating enzyme E2 Z